MGLLIDENFPKAEDSVKYWDKNTFEINMNENHHFNVTFSSVGSGNFPIFLYKATN